MSSTQEKMNIALCMNSKYVMPSLVCMISIIENNKNPIDFYILYASLQESEIAFMESEIKKYGERYSLKPIKITDDRFEQYPTLGRSKEAYFRLLIPDVLPATVDRCLYLDSDVLVKKSIHDFYSTDFNNQALVVCEDLGEILLFHKERHTVLGIPEQYRYFNSGVLLINLAHFRQKLSTALFFDFIKAAQHTPEKLKFLDQDVLNACCYDKVTFAYSNRYNFMEILVNPLLTNNAMRNASIVHFIQKPWRFNYTGANAHYWWHYARKIYPGQHIKFVCLNFAYNTLLKIVLLVVPIQTLKRLKRSTH